MDSRLGQMSRGLVWRKAETVDWGPGQVKGSTSGAEEHGTGRLAAQELVSEEQLRGGALGDALICVIQVESRGVGWRRGFWS